MITLTQFPQVINRTTGNTYCKVLHNTTVKNKHNNFESKQVNIVPATVELI